MSTIRLSAARQPMATSRPNLQLASAPAAKTKRLVATIILFAAGIALANLFFNNLSATAVYELADLQAEKRELTTTTQILGQEVDSLSSQQNLSNSAQKLGMIANANPVFLSIEDQKVMGKPTAALNTDGRVTKNLIANSALTQVSTNLTTTVAEAQGEATKNVANQKATTTQVTSNGDAIPASPTH